MSSNDNKHTFKINEVRDTRIRPRLRADAVQAFLKVLSALEEQSADEIPMWKSCLSCSHFKETGELNGVAIDVEQCTLHGERPPARVIAYSCIDYKDIMDIPF